MASGVSPLLLAEVASAARAVLSRRPGARGGGEPTDEACNGEDDDCDGRTDEAFDLTRDDDNCGRCGSACGPGERCVASECAPVVAPPGYVRLEAGAFWMGSPEEELGRLANEARHRVTLTRAFALKETEVTQAEWWDVMGEARQPGFAGCDACPMERVSWEDAAAYCNALSRREGLPPCYGGAPNFEFAGLDCAGYRLPTEAEWEYAARAGTETAFYTGPITVDGNVCDPIDPNADRAGWYCGNSGGMTHPVASRGKAPNAWGLYDMHGNVGEWVNDWYDLDYGGARGAAAADPLGGPASGGRRVYRGGSWGYGAQFARSAYRTRSSPAIRFSFLGFRPSRSL